MEYRNDTGDPIIHDVRDKPIRPLPADSHRQAALQHLGLHNLKQLSRWKILEEQRKVVKHKGKGFAIIHCFTLLLPLACALALIILNARRTPVGHVSMSVVASVQFVAKFLEILMQIALATIALAVVRHQLLGPEPVPLGGVFAPYRTLDLTYLWSPELWGALTSPSFYGRRKAWFILLIPGIIILSAVIGPCVAILMVPRQITWTSDRGLYMLNDTENTFPTRVLLADNGSLPYETELHNLRKSLTKGAAGLSSFAASSVTTTEGSDSRALRTTFQDNDHVQQATIPTRIVAELLSQQSFDSLTDFATTEAYQPDVEVDCVPINLSNLTNIPGGFVDFGPGKENLRNLIPISYLMPTMQQNNGTDLHILSTYPLTDVYPGNNTEYSYTYSILVHEAPNALLDYSALAVFGSLDDPQTQTNNRLSRNRACTISAAWSLYEANNTVTRTADSARISKSDSSDRMISLPPAWIKRLVTLYMSELNDTHASEFLAPLLAVSLSSFPPISNDLSNQHVLHFSPTDDGTSSFQSSEDVWSRQQFQSIKDFISWSEPFPKFSYIEVYAQGDWTDAASLVKLDIQTYRKEYGYDYKGGPIQLSLVVFGIFVLLVTSYIGYAVLSGNSAMSWRSVADLVMLALNSRQLPPELGPTSVGADTLATFREPVNIRINESDHLELVFDRDPSTQGTMSIVSANAAH